ncbi:MAG: methyltransferase [Anaerolineaceae bacterium]|nr:methyltransferase [Anaerolineaceae bacterium]
MVALYLGILGLLAFLLCVGILGVWLRQHPSKDNAEKSSRIVQFLFFAGLGTPFLIGFFSPGLKHLDQFIGFNPLPWKLFFLITGIILAIPGLYFMGISNKSLRALGSGANAFRLTRRVVETDIYKHTRNPMSLGYYLIGLSIGFISGSTLLTLYVLLGLIPAHVFYLKFFEELELELRFGQSYQYYKQKVPFLIPKVSAE